MRSFFVALQFLTRLPTPQRPIRPESFGTSMRWFPIVGALLGAILAVADAAMTPFWSVEIRSIGLVVLAIALTGALHMDGLMDSCDALLAFTSPDRRLEIMRDSRVGSFAIVGAATVLLLKYAAILSLPDSSRGLAFILMGTLSRWAMVYATVRYPCARPDGLAYAFKSAADWRVLAFATLTTVLLCALSGWAGMAAFMLAWAVTVSFVRYAMSKVPGLTGDLYGALSEIVEIAVAVALPPLWRIWV
jgi:adenosylcobinamide-GDP ribazoletransferase